MNLENLWTDWPTREISGIMKGYILAQLAFWIQQVIVINIEERRKDHVQMFTHHIVTISLIYASYRYHHTRVGNLILVLMDVVDIFLPVCALSHPLPITPTQTPIFVLSLTTPPSLPSASNILDIQRSATTRLASLWSPGLRRGTSCI